MKEIADFIASHPPVDGLGEEDLQRLARDVDIEYHLAGTVVLQRDSAPGRVLLVRAGRVELVDGAGAVVDEAGVGDRIGQDLFVDGSRRVQEVRAAEDTLVYAVRLPGTARRPPPRRLTYPGTLLDPAQRRVTDFVRPLVQRPASTSVRDVARAMTEAGTSCCVVVMPDGGVGVVTDDDLRRKVATGQYALHAPVGGIASVPARTVDESAALIDAYVAMLDHGIHHLVVTSDGQPVGVVRVVDVAAAELRNPLVVRAALEQATTPEALVEAGRLLPATVVELDDAGVPADRMSRLLSTVLDALLRRAVLLAAPRLADDTAAWMVLGSVARREPLPASDVDTALAWVQGDADENRATARHVLDLVERAGVARCADGANADNPVFGRSVQDWQRAAPAWLQNPGETGAVFLASILADSRVVAGGAAHPLAGVLDTARHHDVFLQAIARHALAQRTPLGFVRGFVVEHSGERRGSLDLKRGGILPVTALARWLALRCGDTDGTTVERLERARDSGLLSHDEADMLAGARQVCMGLVTEQQVAALRAHREPSTFVRPDVLDPLSRRQLREAFRAISAVQSRLAASLGLRFT